MSTDILVHAEAGITTLTFNRPDKKNSITSAMYASLADALEAAQLDDTVRCVVFQGHEAVFSAGNDIGDFLNKLEEGDLISLSYETAPHDSPRDPTLIVGDSR